MPSVKHINTIQCSYCSRGKLRLFLYFAMGGAAYVPELETCLRKCIIKDQIDGTLNVRGMREAFWNALADYFLRKWMVDVWVEALWFYQWGQVCAL